MEIKENMYIRTKKGCIAKILGTDIFEEGKGIDINNLEAVYFDKIVNNIDKDIYRGCFIEVFKEAQVSLKLTDLIKVGDFINHEYVDLFNLDYYKKHPDHIKTIITKEQIKEIEYGVGDEK